MRKKQVVIIGYSSCDKETYNTAFEIGRICAENDLILITGGKGGVMEGASAGASKNGGLVVGILPEGDSQFVNEFCDVIIPSGIGLARNYINILSGDLIVIIGGGAGTLSEIAYAWQLGKKILAISWIDGWGRKLAGKKIDQRREDYIISIDSIENFQDILINKLS